MTPLTPPDSHYIAAAIGWLELGNHIEANEELERITPALRAHPAVLEVRCRIYAIAKKWEAVIEIANAAVLGDMSLVNAWLYRSKALHELKRTQEAFDHLDTGVDLFPGHWRVRYDLARYACVLGHRREARQSLEDAIELADDAKAVKLMALDDPDFEPLWARIGEN